MNRSNQRDAILEKLRSVKSHPTAEELYDMLHAAMPHLSLATVYRNLSLFKKQGLIQSVATVSGIERFDGNPDPHVHFICTGCDSVLDLPQLDVPQALSSQAEQDTGCRVTGCQLTFTGLCGNCNL